MVQAGVFMPLSHESEAIDGKISKQDYEDKIGKQEQHFGKGIANPMQVILKHTSSRR